MTTAEATAVSPRDAVRAVALMPNNFDLLRLLAALQVVFGHATDHFLTQPNFLFRLIREAPGVPVFFFISGFLISASWERNPDPRSYALNRFLRIYPAYVLAALVSLGAILAFARLHLPQNLGRLALWFTAQLALLCDWNPSFLRHYGTGVANGSLWTIPVEVAFYVAAPLVWWLLRNTRRKDVALAAIAVASVLPMYLMIFSVRRVDPTLIKALGLTPIPWFWQFLCGWLVQRNLEHVLPLVKGRVLPLLVVNLVLMAACARWQLAPFLFSGSRAISPVNFAALALLIVALAYSRPELATRLLRRNDFSYGIYLFHMPVANALLANGVVGALGAVLTAVLTVPVAALSWLFVERPALARKPKPLYRHESAVTDSS
jgi:peptidoglycan/LPS O-acetylase OafA/YrhL